jgi:hypothetical protein
MKITELNPKENELFLDLLTNIIDDIDQTISRISYPCSEELNNTFIQELKECKIKIKNMICIVDNKESLLYKPN